MDLVNDLINPFLRVFYYQCFERFVVNSVVELHFGPFIFSVLFMMTDDDCCCTFVCFLRFKAELFFNSFRALDKLFFGLHVVTVISVSCVLTFSK